MKYSLLFFLISLIVSTILQARVINIPGDHATIQSGIDVALNEDTVIVKPGTYFENINFRGKAVTIASHYFLDNDSSHIFNTIINGNRPNYPDSGSVIYMISGEDSNSVITGFTLEGGTGTDISKSLGFPARAGGAILAFSGGTIRNNIIRNNYISNFSNCAGGAVFAGLNGNGFLILDQ